MRSRHRAAAERMPVRGLRGTERVRPRRGNRSSAQFGTSTRREQMKRCGAVLLASLCCALLVDLCHAQEAGDFQPATTNVWGAEFPRVDSTGRVQLRVKAPDATKVRVNFWSGPKADMAKQADGFWTITTPPLVPGLHYYTFIIDGAEVSDTGS